MKPLALVLLAGFAFAQARLPQYTREVLSNGAIVLMLPRTGVPLVHFRVLIKGGKESDPQGQAGLAGVTGNLLRRGTEKRSAQQFAEELDSLGATFVANEDNATTAISAEFLSKDFDRGLELLSDAVLHPTYTDSEIRKELSRRIDTVRAAKDNPQMAMASYFSAGFYGRSHPYGNPANEASLKSIERKDVLEYHDKMYRGRNMIIVVTGDFNPTEAKAKLARVFGSVPEGTAYTWSTAGVPMRKGTLLLIDKPDATQTYFEIAQPGIDRSNPDRIVLQLVNTLFGGRFTSMLNDELRVNSGLTYGASCRLEQSRLPGAIAIASYTKSETTAQAIDLALAVLVRFHDRGVSAEQLASAKAYVKGLYPTRTVETIDQLAVLLGDLEVYGLPRDDVDRYFERIDAVTLAQANESIRKYYQRENLTFVILGPAAKIRDMVSRYEPKFTEIALKDVGWGN